MFCFLRNAKFYKPVICKVKVHHRNTVSTVAAFLQFLILESLSFVCWCGYLLRCGLSNKGKRTLRRNTFPTLAQGPRACISNTIAFSNTNISHRHALTLILLSERNQRSGCKRTPPIQPAEHCVPSIVIYNLAQYEIYKTELAFTQSHRNVSMNNCFEGRKDKQ